MLGHSLEESKINLMSFICYFKQLIVCLERIYIQNGQDVKHNATNHATLI